MLTQFVTGTKRRRSEDDDPQEFEDSAMLDLEASGDGSSFAPSLSERVKRRRRRVTYKEDDSGEEEGGKEDDGEFRPSKMRKKNRDKDPDFMTVDDDGPDIHMASPRGGGGDKTSRADVASALAEG